MYAGGTINICLLVGLPSIVTPVSPPCTWTFVVAVKVMLTHSPHPSTRIRPPRNVVFIDPSGGVSSWLNSLGLSLLYTHSRSRNAFSWSS